MSSQTLNTTETHWNRGILSTAPFLAVGKDKSIETRDSCGSAERVIVGVNRFFYVRDNGRHQWPGPSNRAAQTLWTHQGKWSQSTVCQSQVIISLCPWVLSQIVMMQLCASVFAAFAHSCLSWSPSIGNTCVTLLFSSNKISCYKQLS